MRFHTNKETYIGNQMFAFQLRKLCRENFDLFEQLQDFIPHPVYISERDTLGYSYFGKQLLNKGDEIENLFKKGRTYLKKISCPVSLNNAEIKSRIFHQNNDFNDVCSYTQHLLLKGEMTYMFTNKLLLNENHTISVCNMVDDLGKIGQIFKEIAPKVFKNHDSFQLFQSLTKQEKKIIELLSKGFSNKEIGEQLFISIHTVHTHRKNIYHKLGIKNIGELIRFALIIDLF